MWTALTGVALMALSLLVMAPRAEAAFTTPKCQGPEITGRGASFATNAHTLFNASYKNEFCAGLSDPGEINVLYSSSGGSGAGRLSMKVRDGIERFGMSDEPPDLVELQQMNLGTGDSPPGSDTIATDNGQIHVIPAAVGALSAIVNWPNNCDRSLLPAASLTPETDTFEPLDGTSDGVVRVRFTKDQYEAMWAQGASGAPLLDWDDIPGFSDPAVGVGLDDDADCAVPVLRVVRSDESGSTFVFKDYLGAINPARGWRTTFRSGVNRTRAWPGSQIGTYIPEGCAAAITDAPGVQPDATDHLTVGCSVTGGGGTLASQVNTKDGSIGYADIATARGANPSFAVTPRADDLSPFDNDRFWTQIQNGATPPEFTEPTVNPAAFRTDITDAQRGANCNTTPFSNVPGATLSADWTAVSGVNAPTGYGICSLTYGLVFDDHAKVWGTDPAEEQKARTVKDYWETIVTTAAQEDLPTRDYSPLPANILATSRAGVTSIDWNKSGGGGGGGGGGGTVTPPPVVDPPVVIPPSNQFSITRTRISRAKKNATISVKLPGAGRLVLVATTKSNGKTIRVARVVLTANRAGTFNLVVKPTGKAKNLLVEDGRQKVALKLTFTPNGTGGTPRTNNRSVTLKAKPPNRGN